MKYTIHIINLDRNKERWNAMEIQCKLQNIKNYKRFAAFDGKKLNTYPEVELVHKNALMSAERGYRISHEEHNYGSIGCYLSHVGVWKRILESNDDFGIIFEDDIKLPNQFMKHFENMILDAPPKWDLIVFGPYELIKEKPSVINKRRNHTFIKGRWFMLNSYVISKQCCEKFLKYVYPIRIQIDWWVSSYVFNYNIWILQKPITNFNIGYGSDIEHTPVIPNWLAKNELLKYDL